MGPSPHLWFLHAKQRLLDQSTRLYGYQTSPVVWCTQNSVICTRMTSLYGFLFSSVVLCMQNSDFRTRLTSLYGSQTSSVVFSTHNSVLSTRIKRTYLTWFAKIDHFPQKVILIYARSKCNRGAFFERDLRVPFISRRNKLRAAAIWRSYVPPCGRYEPKSIDLSSRSA